MKIMVLFIFLFSLFFSLPALGAESGSVTITLPEYERLVKSVPVRSEEPAPPTDYYIPRAHYRLRCESTRTLLTAAIDLIILRKGWARVPLLDVDQPLRASRLDGAPASLVCQEKSYYLFIQGPGSHRVELDIARDSLLTSPLLNFTIPLTTIPTIDVESLLPGMEIGIARSTLTGQETSPKASVAHYVLPHEGTLTVTARPRPEKNKGTAAAEMNGELSHVLVLGEALLSCTTVMHLKIPGGKLHEAALRIPDGYEVTGAEGEHLADRRRNGGTLRLLFDAPLEGDYTCTVRLEKRLRGVSDRFTFTPPVLLSARRQKGYIALAARTNVEIKTSNPVRTSPVDVTDLPAEMASAVPYPLLSGYKYLSPDCSLGVEVKRYQDIPLLVATVDREEVKTLMTGEGLLVTMAAFHVRNNAKQFMTITLPGGAEVWGVFVAGIASKPGRDEKGRILIPLERSVINGKELGAFTVEVIYVEKEKKLSAAGIPLMKLPAIDMPVSTLSFEALLPDEAFVVRSSGMKRTASFQFSAHDALNYLSPANYLRARAQGQLTACKSNLSMAPTPRKPWSRGCFPSGRTSPSADKLLHSSRSCSPPARRRCVSCTYHGAWQPLLPLYLLSCSWSCSSGSSQRALPAFPGAWCSIGPRRRAQRLPA